MKKPGEPGLSSDAGRGPQGAHLLLLLRLLPVLRSLLWARLLRLLASAPLRPASLRLILPLLLPLLACPRLPRLPLFALLRLLPDDDFEDAMACSFGIAVRASTRRAVS